MPDSLDDDGHHGYDHYSVDDEAEIILHKWPAAQKVARRYNGKYPDERPADVEKQKTALAHARNPGHKRSEGADDGNETRQNNRFSTMLFVKHMGLFQVLFFSQR